MIRDVLEKEAQAEIVIRIEPKIGNIERAQGRLLENVEKSEVDQGKETEPMAEVLHHCLSSSDKNDIHLLHVDAKPSRRSRSREHRDKRSGVPTPDNTGDHSMSNTNGNGSEVDEDDVEAQMQAMMGFGGFGTTKDKKVANNDVGTTSIVKKAQYRQYM